MVSKDILIASELKRPPLHKINGQKRAQSCTGRTRNYNSTKNLKSAKKMINSKLAPFSFKLANNKMRNSASSSLVSPQYRHMYEGGPTCLKSIVEKKTMLKEIEKLSKALKNQQEKAEIAIQRKSKVTKKVKNAKDQIDYLKKRVDDLKRNEENLLQDLVQQQAIAKDALKSLDSLRDVMTSEKAMMKDELDHYYNMLIDQEREKYQTLYSRYRTLQPYEQQCKEFEIKNANTEHLIREQKDQITNLQAMLDNSNSKCQNLQDELKDTSNDFKNKQLEYKRAYEGKEQEFKDMISELKYQLEDLDKRSTQNRQQLVDQYVQELKTKDEELVIRNREIEMLHKTYDARTDELTNEVDDKERELLEAKLRIEELDSENKRLREDQEDMQYESMTDPKFTPSSQMIDQQSVDIHTKGEKTQSTYNLDLPSSIHQEYEYGNIYGKLTSELYNLRSEINNMKSDRATSHASKGKIVRQHQHTETFGEHDEHMYIQARKQNQFRQESTDYDNDSVYNQIETQAVENNFKAALASYTEDEMSNFKGTQQYLTYAHE